MLKKNNQEYQKLEEKLKLSAEKYTTTTFNYPEDNKDLIITKEKLIEEGYLDNLNYKKEACLGYVIVTKDQVYKYKSYIKCENYTTDGFKEEKLK